MKDATLPVILIALGIVWLLHEIGWLPSLHSVGAIVLIIVGITILLLEGITKTSIVSGPLIIFCGIAWYGRQQAWFGWNVILPVGLIVSGLCLLLSRAAFIPHQRRIKTRNTAARAE